MERVGWEGRAAAAFTLVVLALRLWFARHMNFCGTPDSCYALGVAQALATRHTFRVPFLFDLLSNSLHVPSTGLEYWRPGVSLLLVVLRPLGGVTLRGALVITALMGVVWALAAWHVAMRTTHDRRIALASYALCLVLSPGWESSLTPDPTLYYAATIAWFLALFTVRRQGLFQDLLALACVGAAYLIRNDAGLLLIPLLVVLWQRHRLALEARRHGRDAPDGTSARYIAAVIAVFFVALAPMHLLYKHVLGTAFPSGAAQALFVDDLSDFNNYGAPVSLHSLLAHGVKHLITLRAGATAMILYRVLALLLGYAALIFLPSLAVKRDGATTTVEQEVQLPEMAGPATFAVVILLVYGLVLPAVGVFSALRSSTALLPWVSVIVVVAILRAAKSKRIAAALAGAVIAAYVISGVMEDRREMGPMNAIGDADRAQAKALAAMGVQPESAVVMTADPVQFSVTTGYTAIPLPGNGLGAITNEALDLHATHAILDDEHLPGSQDVVIKELRPERVIAIPRQRVLLLELSPERQRQ
jgi:hypothetical protein